ncbi:M14 family metallopeptidase [Nocardioides bizhenqiangii]|uniref:M14 family zinc carboxypeptidase n=1 Tax=Nocardioides bizhenqiangii TaxID=3095076 RepID=A0ABZ0ZML7_9ACTN|nr:M14 family zinc carboxypeptidase [Nocardioides sp. HM61]WQQ25557.1 M14 family zinc carboxypeptidase [Nocardioides sp. HM61]
MRRLLGIVFAAAILIAALAAVPGGAAPAPPDKAGGPLDVYTTMVTPDQWSSLAAQGFDLGEQPHSDQAGKRVEVELIVDRADAARLRSQGFDLKLTRVKGGQTVRQFANSQAVGGYNVWRSYDEPGGIRDQLRAAARANPQIAKLVKIGTTHQGREILALKLTQGARGKVDGSRPAVLYSGTQHAREWIATEVTRRLMKHYIDRWRANDKAVRNLLKTTELWFVPVANPDGYQYSFDVERLWRKNLRDNNGDGQITGVDGVDPNRNFPNHWGYDNEGSSSIQSSQTYRGPAPLSEPETKAMVGLLDRIGFAFQINYHSNGRWILYAEGWQIGTPTSDDPIYYALSGNLDEPAIEDFHPGLSSDVLYVTNGETTDYAHAQTGALAWTPELSAGCDGCGFVFPDDEQLVQEEFLRNLPFAHSVARSAVDPDDPKTVTGIETEPFYVDSADPYKRGIPEAQFSFTKSYGDPQPVAVIAKRSLGPVTLKYRINDGAVQSAPTAEWDGGETYTPASVHYHQMRGVVTGTDPGDSVEVWFEGGGETSDSFTYDAVSETGNRVLVVAAEDYTGASPVQAPGPHYTDYYLDALEANGETGDVYDVDANGRVAPDVLGVLSHYDAVIWYSGDDIVTRRTGTGAGNADRLALDEMLEMRSYMNEGGKVLYTGNWAGQQYTAVVGNQYYDPKGEIACNPLPPGTDSRRCLLLRGSGDGTNDVLQYYFGGYLAVGGDGIAEDGTAFDVTGIDEPLDGILASLNGPDSADNQDHTGSFISTSGILPVDEFKQFESWPAARWDKPGGPFDPHSGTQYVYSQIADVSYKRLTREVAVPAGGGSLSFWTSYDTEPDWDFLTVEARTPGDDDWTTLPDANGHTSPSTGESCASGWIEELHPHLAHYQTSDGAGNCTATGSSGEWHAASGSSSGWQEWSVDLSEWAGGSVEISIAYVSDWGTQNLGVFVDDITLPDGTSTSFEGDLGGWEVTGPPPGSAPNSNNFIRTDASGFPVGNAIATPRSLLLGFGLEGVSTADERNEVMGRALDHLLE